MSNASHVLRWIFVICVSSLVAAPAFGATFTVNSPLDAQDANPGDGVCQTGIPGECTLRAAITEANAFAGNDVINLPAGTFQITLAAPVEDLNAGGDFDIRSNVSINGAGSGSTIIQAAGSFNSTTERVMQFVAGTSSVSGVTMRFGGTPGGGYAGGILADGIFATNNGLPLPNLTFTDVTIRDNTSSGPGGGVRLMNNATATFNNSLITGNFAGTSGGGIDSSGSQLGLTNTTVSSNSATSNTGAAAGGGISLSGGSGTFTGSSVSNNTVSTSASNANALGGGIAGSSLMTVTGTSISGNTASATGGGQSIGGGIYEDTGIVSVSHSLISGNTASRAGGAYGLGMAVDRSAFLNNTGTVFGGGFVNAGATAAITSTTFSGNSSGGIGSAVLNFNPNGLLNATTNLKFATIARNTSSSANAAAVANVNTGSGSVPLTNMQSSVAADNTAAAGAGADTSGVASQGYNHVEAPLGTFTPTTGDVVGSDPALGAVTGSGANSVLLPASNSPVIDTIPSGTAGCGTAPTNFDQRGVRRPLDSNNDSVAACEKGAAEVTISTAAAVSVSGRVTNSSGAGIRAAVITLTTASGARLTAITNAFGYYRLEGVQSGETYLSRVTQKGYAFAPRTIVVDNELTSVDFVAF